MFPSFIQTRFQHRMPQGRLSLARILWLTCVCLCLLPRAVAAAEPLLVADLDGDGLYDRVTISHREPTVLRLWLSASGKTHRIHLGTPVLHVVAMDLDGDHRPELIAHDAKSRLHVWTWKRKAFKPYRSRMHVRFTLAPGRHAVNDAVHSDPANACVDTSNTAVMLHVSPLMRVLDPVMVYRSVTYAVAPVRSLTFASPALPRPPPPMRLSL
jgi:hypothetical protein